MCSSYPTLLAFSKTLSGWEFCVTNASGLSSGLLIGWNPHIVRYNAFETVGGILVHANFRGSSTTLSILNCYGLIQAVTSFGIEEWWEAFLLYLILS